MRSTEDFYRQCPRSPVLDVGCSKGYDVEYFSRHGFQVEGCDVGEKAVERARENYPGRTFFVHDFERGPSGKRYNSVYAFDYPRFLENMRSSLNPGGTLILATPNVLGLKNRIRFLLEGGGYSKVLKVLGYSSVPLPVSLCDSLTAISEAMG